MLDVRKDFPLLAANRKLAYLDTAASAQKPKAVIDCVAGMYKHGYANVHRGIYKLSENATSRYERARATIAGFIGAQPAELVFTGGATHGLNLAAYTIGAGLKEGSEVIITEADHHANIVPWQILRERTGLVLKIWPVEDDGSFDIGKLKSLVTSKTKVISVPHVSNVLGTVLPAAEICRIAAEAGALSVVDGCQGVNHLEVNVKKIGCDFYAFSGHKLYGPTGAGALYMRQNVARTLTPFMGGGDMIKTVAFERTVYADPPARFEAGTPPIVQAVGMAAAADYVRSVGIKKIAAHEGELLAYMMDSLRRISGVRLIGVAPRKVGVQAFTVDRATPADIAMLLDQENVAVRVGHHCAEPLHRRFGISASVRASLGMYSSPADVDRLVRALRKAKQLLGV